VTEIFLWISNSAWLSETAGFSFMTVLGPCHVSVAISLGQTHMGKGSGKDI
jgi:hypothetical protein